MASSTKSPTSPAFPTFLDTDPYPSASRDGRPMSSGSIATNATTESGGDDFRPSTDRPRSNVPTLTGPVGEPGLPPSRATGAAYDATTQNKRTVAHPPGSRKAAARPNTGAEATHLTSLPVQTVFRPMSSQKLQAQRNQLPGGNAEEQDAAIAGSSRDIQSNHRHRYSNASVNTLKELQAMSRDEEAPPLPVSRGTQITSDGTNTAGSVNSATPLQARQNGNRTLDAGQFVTNKERLPDQRSKSPRSLRASLGMGSRRTSKLEQERRPSPGLHEKLDSNPPSANGGRTHVSSQPSRPSKSIGKNYEYFAGNLLFCMSGRCLNTRAKPLNVLTFVIVTIPAALFFAFSAPWLWHHVSPALPIVFAYFYFITMSSFVHAAVTDPGILPRNIHPHPPNPEEERDPLTVGPTMTEWIMVKSFLSSHRSPHPGRPNNSSGEDGQPPNGPTTAMEVPTKYCKTCNIWRPPRAHHCRVCDACIESQDHHCVWLNNCVGRRNYRYFFAFVALGSVLALMLIAFSIIHIVYYAKRHHLSFLDSFTGRTPERVAFAVFIYSILALPYPGSLFMYHTFLVARGETTREYLNSHKFQPKDRHRPFTQSSSLRNWIAVLVRPRPPSSMQFRHAYRPGDVRFGHSAPKKQRKKDLQGRYSVPPSKNGVNGNASSAVGGDGAVEMKRFSNAVPRGGQAPKPQAKNAGGVTGPVNRTPR